MSTIQIVSNVKLVRTRKPGELRDSKYPWAALIAAGVGCGFPIPEGVKLKGFRTLAQKAGVARGAMFSVGTDENGVLMCVFKGLRAKTATSEAEQAQAAAAEADLEDAVAAGQDVDGDDADADDGEGFDEHAEAA